ncbi:MAG: hypothetical protein V1851_02655 [Patescibacteria group bacterium]
MERQCSELFGDIFDSHTGGCYRECACGRVHFTTERGYDWNDGELEDLLKREEKDPDKFIPSDHTVRTMNINGQEIVYGCCCNLAKKYEAFIRNNAPRIAEYLNAMAESLRKKADEIQVDASR